MTLDAVKQTAEARRIAETMRGETAMTMNAQRTQTLTQVEFAEEDFAKAEQIARALGYEQTVYTSSSDLWGLFCLPENPRFWRGKPQALQGGCIIKTLELGLLFVQDGEDRNYGYDWEHIPA